MGEFPRKANGRRIFTVEFKREVVQQILRGEKTLAELSRELDIVSQNNREWMRRYESGRHTPSRFRRFSEWQPGLHVVRNSVRRSGWGQHI
jgi:transposase-like protein